MSPPAYMESLAQYDAYWPKLKLLACPHCHAVGFLIRHGFLKGYKNDSSQEIIKRGWRVFCSNRGQRNGCGGTYSILLSCFLRRRSVTAIQLWSFLEQVLVGLAIQAAWFSTGSTQSEHCAYRLWKSWKKSQSWIRERLCRLNTPPRSHQTDRWLQAIEHLKAVFPSPQNPVAAFQFHFQKPFFPCS